MTAADQSEHIVKAYDDEFAQLRKLFSQMSGLAEAQLDGAMRAVAKRDESLAESVRIKDKDIDDLETEIEALVVRMLALRQPVANDLRFIVAMLRMSADIERIGDYAKNIAKRVGALAQMQTGGNNQVYRSVSSLGRLVQAMLKDVFDACTDEDLDKAVSVWEADQEVDALYTSIFRELLTYMMEDPRYITAGTHLLFIAKNLERIGDHATNVAETLHYRIDGKRLEERRPKDDDSNMIVVGNPEGEPPAAA